MALWVGIQEEWLRVFLGSTHYNIEKQVLIMTPATAQPTKRQVKAELSPELLEVLHMLKALETQKLPADQN